MLRQRLFACAAAAIALGLGPARAQEPLAVAEVRFAESAEHDLVLVTGTVQLPAAGIWIAVNQPPGEGAIRQVQLRAPQELLRARYGRPGRDDGPPPGAGTEGGEVEYALTGLLPVRGPAEALIALRNVETDARLQLRWVVPADAGQAPDAAQIVREWHRTRCFGWFHAAGGSNAPVLAAWCRAFGNGSPFDEQRQRERRREPAPETALGVLGGRAAIRETLQLEVLRLAGQPAGETAQPVPLAEIKGVEVKSHPYAEMLAGARGGTLPLADCVPADRAFVYVARPASLLPLLDDGAGFLHEAGVLQTGNAVHYDLASRSLARLGLNRQWLEALLRSGAVAELALVLPDLFLIDGTELTVVARVPQRPLLQPLLALVQVPLPARDGEIGVRQLPDGVIAHWAARGDLVVVGTQRGEVERVLALMADANAPSLGRSAEFRYMLTQLAPTARTRAFVYLSDLFIRRLTGPEVKIGQYRRLQARAALEELAAAALLYRYDAHPEPPTVETLLRHGYLHGQADAPPWAGLALRPDGVAESAAWGTLAAPRTLLAVPVTAATAAEAQAYRAYVENYARYWRQYFDPIALRLDDAGGGTLELTAFILPLIDNSLYNGLREMLSAEPAPEPLRIPQLDPPGVVTLSVRLPLAARQELARNALPSAAAQTGLNPRLFAYIGPGLHLVVRDSDPVLAFGSGDLAGAFGAAGMLEGGRGGETLFIPVLASVLTRPCALLVELTDPKAVGDILRRGIVAGPRRDREVQATLTQYAGRDAWLYTLELFGVFQLRFGLEICGDYLAITNVPWSQKMVLREPLSAPQTVARLALAPAAAQQQLPALFTANAGRERDAALQGMGALLPLLLCGAADPAAAAAQHRQLFGFAPEHPGDGRWLWQDGLLASDRYGRPGQLLEPVWRPGDRNFGLFRRVSDAAVGLQFEDTGLRATCRWRVVPAAANPPPAAPKTPPRQ